MPVFCLLRIWISLLDLPLGKQTSFTFRGQMKGNKQIMPVVEELRLVCSQLMWGPGSTLEGSVPKTGRGLVIWSFSRAVEISPIYTPRKEW